MTTTTPPVAPQKPGEVASPTTVAPVVAAIGLSERVEKMNTALAKEKTHAAQVSRADNPKNPSEIDNSGLKSVKDRIAHFQNRINDQPKSVTPKESPIVDASIDKTIKSTRPK